MKSGPNAAGLLAPLAPWLKDENVSEILMNKPGEVYIEKSGQFKRYSVPELNERAVTMLFQLIANENQQQLNASSPLLSASLADGSRVQLVLPPTAKFHTLAIRRKVVQQLSLTAYEESRFYRYAKSFAIQDNQQHLSEDEKQLHQLYQQQAWGPFVRLAIDLKKNIVISGGTSSGKTTYLNACLQHIPLHERLLLLEDAREITTPHPNQVSLLASKGQQGLANVTMQDLVQCCLRLRPDRIIIGEIRGKEILDFLGACSTGHAGSITSIHANNPRIALMRMTQLYKQNNVPAMSDDDIMHEINQVVDVIIQLEKTAQGRQVQSIYYKFKP